MTALGTVQLIVLTLVEPIAALRLKHYMTAVE